MAFADSSTNNFQLTAFGNAQISTSVKKYGDGSVYFDGNGDYLELPLDPAFDFGSDNFTIECWFYTANSNWQTLIARWGSGGNAIFLGVEQSNQGIQFYLNNSFVCGGGSISPSTWNHVAIVRSGQNILYFLNGLLIQSVIWGSGSVNSSTEKLRIGYDNNINPYYNGYIDDLRITKGIARYTSNFTPPQQQLPAPSDPYQDNVSLLLHMDSEPLYQNLLAFWKLDNLNDFSTNQRTLTNNGSVQFVSGKIGNCAQFNGSNSLTVLNPDTTTVNTKSFSFWVKRTTSTTDQQGLICGLIAGYYIHTQNNKLSFWPGTGSFNPESSSTLPVDTWVHCVVIYNNPTLKFYINGVLDTNVSLGANASLPSYTNICLGAAQQGQLHFTGELDAVGIWNRVLTESEISELYNSGTGKEPNLQTFTDSSSNNFTLSAFGDAQISTSTKKFGSGSAYFDGDGDYIAISDNISLNFNTTDDFTIEGWIRFNSLEDGVALVSKGTNLTTSGWTLYYYQGLLYFGVPYVSNDINGTFTPSLNTWYHLACIRNSGTIKLFVDGSEIASSSNSINYTTTEVLRVGNSHSNNFLNGYIDELRITKGVARYTSNFVPQTAPFVNPTPDPWSNILNSTYANSIVAAYDFRDYNGSNSVISKIGPNLETSNVTQVAEGLEFVKGNTSWAFANSTVACSYPFTMVFVAKTTNTSTNESVLINCSPVRFGGQDILVFTRGSSSQGLMPYNGMDNQDTNYLPNGTEWYFYAVSFLNNGTVRYATRKASGNLNGTVNGNNGSIFNGYPGVAAGFGSQSQYGTSGKFRLALFINQAFSTEAQMDYLFNTILSGPASDLALQ